MNKYLSKLAAGITPYLAGEQPQGKIIKLNTNENPYPPSEKAIQAGLDAVNASLRLYPKTDGGEFRSAAARVNGVDEKNVFCANGSDELLAFCFAAFFDKDKKVKTPDISYSFYPVWAEFFGLTLDVIPLKKDFTIDVPAFFNSEGGVVIANPNAPTGIALSVEDIELIVKNNPDKVVVVDEAYAAFGAQSVLPLVHKYDNILIARTMSKSHSLAGMRAGYAIGSELLIDGLERIKDSFNSYPTDSVCQHVAAAALLDTEYNKEVVQKVISAREFAVKELKELGFKVLPSFANFIFISHKMSAEKIFEQLKKRNIYVRYFKKPLIDNFLRVTIGTQEEMEEFIRAIKEIVL